MSISVSSLLGNTKTTFAVCPATGIPYTVSFPNMGIDFQFKSPYASLHNVEAIAKLPYDKLRSIPKVTLAGIALAYMRFTALCETHNLKSIDCNMALQLCETHTIIAIIKRIEELPVRKRNSMPQLSFSSMLSSTQHSTPQHLVKAWLKACNEILHPPTVESIEIEAKIEAKAAKAEQAKQLTVADRKELKAAVSNICVQTDCSANLATILRYICDGMTIVTMDDNIRSKVIAKLEIFSSDEATTVIKLLKKYSTTLENDFMDRAMDNSSIAKHKPTISEIIAAKRAASTAKES